MGLTLEQLSDVKFWLYNTYNIISGWVAFFDGFLLYHHYLTFYCSWCHLEAKENGIYFQNDFGVAKIQLVHYNKAWNECMATDDSRKNSFPVTVIHSPAITTLSSVYTNMIDSAKILLRALIDCFWQGVVYFCRGQWDTGFVEKLISWIFKNYYFWLTFLYSIGFYVCSVFFVFVFCSTLFRCHINASQTENEKKKAHKRWWARATAGLVMKRSCLCFPTDLPHAELLHLDVNNHNLKVNWCLIIVGELYFLCLDLNKQGINFPASTHPPFTNIT